jgi:hypothetical protein
MNLLCALSAMLLTSYPAAANRVRVYHTSQAGDRITEMPFEVKAHQDVDSRYFDALVAEVLNSRKSPAQIEFEWHGRSLNTELPVFSIATFLWSEAS